MIGLLEVMGSEMKLAVIAKRVLGMNGEMGNRSDGERRE